MAQLTAYPQDDRRAIAAPARALLGNAMRGNRATAAALLLCVAGWSLIWAQALGIFDVVPVWMTVAAFYGGLAMIPFCRPGAAPLSNARLAVSAKQELARLAAHDASRPTDPIGF